MGQPGAGSWGAECRAMQGSPLWHQVPPPTWDTHGEVCEPIPAACRFQHLCLLLQHRRGGYTAQAAGGSTGTPAGCQGWATVQRQRSRAGLRPAARRKPCGKAQQLSARQGQAPSNSWAAEGSRVWRRGRPRLNKIRGSQSPPAAPARPWRTACPQQNPPPPAGSGGSSRAAVWSGGERPRMGRQCGAAGAARRGVGRVWCGSAPAPPLLTFCTSGTRSVSSL